MIPVKDVQAFLGVRSDGVIGHKTLDAARGALEAVKIKTAKWTDARLFVGAEQLFLQHYGYTGDLDGYEGPQTRAAFEAWVKIDRHAAPASDAPSAWPRERDVPTFYGDRGANQVMVDIPWKCYLTWDPAKKITRVSVHKKVAESVGRIFRATVEAYGAQPPDPLCRYSGSLNVRKKVGGTSWSMHSWGIAIDWDDDHNKLHTHAPHARLSAPEYTKWWEIWESEGWVSLGRTRNYDWMHVQAARL